MTLLRATPSSLVSLCVLVGCTTSSSYPDSWPAPVINEASVCPDVNGVYDNFGAWGDEDDVVLARTFFPLRASEPQMNHYELLAVTHLSIEGQESGELVIRAWVGDELYREGRTIPGQPPCRDGKLVYQDTSWHGGGLPPFVPVVYRSSVERLLSRATDGSLLMENHELSAGVALVLPVALKAQYWYRFPPFDYTAAAPPDDGARPRGVRSEPAPAYQLKAPPNAPAWSGFGDAGACLAKAAAAAEAPDAQALAALGGRSTQAFAVQNGPRGELVQTGTVVGNNWLPGTHDLRIEKQHWLPPAVTDRYVLCLLDLGYSWSPPVGTGND